MNTTYNVNLHQLNESLMSQVIKDKVIDEIYSFTLNQQEENHERQ